MVVVVKDGFGLVSKDKRRRRGAVLTASTSRRATRRSSAPRSSFFLKGVARTKGRRFVRVLVRVPTYVCTIKHARCYFLLLLLLPNSRPSPAVMVVSSLRSLARSRQRRFPARDDRAPPAENDKHQMFLFPVARIHRVFPRVRHFRRGVRVRRVRALLLGIREQNRGGGAFLSSSSSYPSSSRERGRRESAQSRDAGHVVFDMRFARKTMTKKKCRFDGRFFPIEIDTFRVVVVVVLRERC